jgi:hypothetical protein
MKFIFGEYVDDGEQQIEVQVDKWDTWSADYTIGYVALPLLKQLKETKQGAPNVDLEDVPLELWPSSAEQKNYQRNGETDPNFFKRWDYVLGEMIFAFETKCGDLQDWESNFSEYEELPNFEFVGIGEAQLRLFPDEVGKTEDYQYYEMKSSGHIKTDWDGRMEYQERITNGFRLFGKYYESLWD